MARQKRIGKKNCNVCKHAAAAARKKRVVGRRKKTQLEKFVDRIVELGE
jgi:hypothetical protein